VLYFQKSNKKEITALLVSTDDRISVFNLEKPNGTKPDGLTPSKHRENAD
jgi:hypothetical protein